MPRLGLTLRTDIKTNIELAQRAEEAGFEIVWSSDFYNRNAFVSLAAIAVQTRTLKLGTGIAYAFARSPVLNAAAAMDLDELSQGRMVLGLGSGTKRMMEAWYGVPWEHPAPRMKEAIELIRTVWASHAGQPVRFEGRFYNIYIERFQRPNAFRDRIPIYVAAVNPRMLQVAGEVADGLLGHILYSPRYIQEVVHRNVALGLARAGRPRQSFDLAPWIITAISADPKQARREAKYTIAYYATTRTYDIIFDFHGWGKERNAIREAFQRNDIEAMADAVSDEMVEAIALAGTADQCRQKLLTYKDLVDLPVLASPWFGLAPQRVKENHQAIIDVFSPR